MNLSLRKILGYLIGSIAKLPLENTQHVYKEDIALALTQIKEELIKEVEKESEDIDRTCREFLPHSAADYIPSLVKTLKLQIQQIIEEMCK